MTEQRSVAYQDQAAVLTALAAAYRQIAEWAPNVTGEMTEDEWRELAYMVEHFADDGLCCPLCQEVDCDEGCPLEPFRGRAATLETPAGTTSWATIHAVTAAAWFGVALLMSTLNYGPTGILLGMVGTAAAIVYGRSAYRQWRHAEATAKSWQLVRGALTNREPGGSVGDQGGQIAKSARR